MLFAMERTWPGQPGATLGHGLRAGCRGKTSQRGAGRFHRGDAYAGILHFELEALRGTLIRMHRANAQVVYLMAFSTRLKSACWSRRGRPDRFRKARLSRLDQFDLLLSAYQLERIHHGLDDIHYESFFDLQAHPGINADPGQAVLVPCGKPMLSTPTTISQRSPFCCSLSTPTISSMWHSRA